MINVSYGISLTDTCNLRCTGCHLGRYLKATGGMKRPYFITVDTYCAILDKIHRESVCRKISWVGLSEPLIHPEIIRLAEESARRGIKVDLSTNLNHHVDFDRLFATGAVSNFRVSSSGMRQEIYERGHYGGQVEKVLTGMKLVAEAAARHPGVALNLRFHIYKDNLEDVQVAAEFARNHGFAFSPVYARSDISQAANPLRQREHGRELLEKLIAEEAFFLARMPIDFLHEFRNPLYRTDVPRHCPLLDEFYIEPTGEVTLCCCCTLYENRRVIGNFLTMPQEELQRLRCEHEFCRNCPYYGESSLDYLSEICNDILWSIQKKYGLTSFHEIVDLARRAAQNTAAGATLRGLRLAIFGAGPLGRNLARLLSEVCGSDVVCLIDDDPAKQQDATAALPVLARSAYASRFPASLPVLLAIGWSRGVAEKVAAELRATGHEKVYLTEEFFTQYPEILRPFLKGSGSAPN